MEGFTSIAVTPGFHATIKQIAALSEGKKMYEVVEELHPSAKAKLVELQKSNNNKKEPNGRQRSKRR